MNQLLPADVVDQIMRDPAKSMEMKDVKPGQGL